MVRMQVTAEPAVPQLVVTSEFAAPRDLLFRAYTDPELLVRWLEPHGLTLTIDHLDLRHGGTWRYIGSDTDGGKYSFRGVFHGTPSPDGIVQTSESDSMPGHVCLETITFTEREGTTTVTQTTVYQSARDRDRVLRYDMAEDIHESVERLEQLLAQLVPVTPTPWGRIDVPYDRRDAAGMAADVTRISPCRHHRGVSRSSHPADSLNVGPFSAAGSPSLSRLSRR
jgi:uncharacterized protein YndB with AHSA1/START domain